MATPANTTITGAELATRMDALRVEIDTLTDAAYMLSFDSDPGTASVAQGLHKTLRQFQRDTDKRGHGGLKSRLRHPANSAEKE